MTLPEKFRDFILTHNLFQRTDRLLIAVSGGLDSVVLTALCKACGHDFAIAHCNFQLRGAESDRDENLVRELAEQYNVKLFTTRFETQQVATQKKISIQEAARELRYAWFEQTRKENGYHYILTAHHADDNIETVVMNFFRGTGIKGLRGIEPLHDHIARPLLFARRSELESYRAQQQLAFAEDSSNAKDDYARNFFRHQLIPLVEKVYPAAQGNVLANITRFRDVAQLYADAVSVQKRKLLEVKGNEVHIPVLKLQKTPALHSIVYEIIRDYDFSAAQVPEVIALLESETGKFVASPTHRIIRNRNWLIIASHTAEKAEIMIIDGPGSWTYAMGTLQLTHIANPSTTLPVEKHIASLDAASLQFPLLLRKWKQGDYFYPMGMQKKKKLSRFFIDQKLSKTEKEKIWVLEMQKKIAWVIGHRIDDRFKVTQRTQEILQIKSLNVQTG